MRRRTAGKLGPGGGPGSIGVRVLLPEPQVLEKGEGELAQERVVVQAAPGAALEMVQPQLVLELLVHLFADPSSAARWIRCRRHGRYSRPRACLDQGGQGLEQGIGGKVGEIVFPLAGSAVLADEPCLRAR